MGRPQTVSREKVVAAAMRGLNTKSIAFDIGTTIGTVCKILNNAGIFKHYLTPAEHAAILRTRRART